MIEPTIEYQREVILTKILKIPDARFKSGYRKHQVVAMTRAIIPDGMDGTTIQQTHLLKNGKFTTMTEAFGQVTFTLHTRETDLA